LFIPFTFLNFLLLRCCAFALFFDVTLKGIDKQGGGFGGISPPKIV
jgi:hypothetical protein